MVLDARVLRCRWVQFDGNKRPEQDAQHSTAQDGVIVVVTRRVGSWVREQAQWQTQNSGTGKSTGTGTDGSAR